MELPKFLEEFNLNLLLMGDRGKKALCNFDRRWHSLYHCWTISLWQRGFPPLPQHPALPKRISPWCPSVFASSNTAHEISILSQHRDFQSNEKSQCVAIFQRSLQMLFPLLIYLRKSTPDISWNSVKHTLLLLLSWRLWDLFAYYSPPNGNAQFI